MLTQKVELAVAKTHQNISSPNLRPFTDSDFDAQSRCKIVTNRILGYINVGDGLYK